MHRAVSSAAMRAIPIPVMRATAAASMRRVAAASSPVGSATAAAASAAHSALVFGAAWCASPASPLFALGMQARGICSRTAAAEQRAAIKKQQQQQQQQTQTQQHSQRLPLINASFEAHLPKSTRMAGAAGAGAAATTTVASDAASAASTSPVDAVDPNLLSSAGELTSFAPPLNPDNPLTVLPELAQQALAAVHSMTGLPWWASIMLMTVTVRTLFFYPLATGQAKALVGMTMAAPDLQALNEEFEKVKAAYAKVGQAVPMHVVADQQTKRTAIQKKHGWSMWMQFRSILFTAPVFMSFFWGLRSMAHVDPSFCVGGFSIGSLSWQNLAELDSTWVLPILNGLCMMLTILANSENSPVVMKKIMAGIAVASVWFTATAVPSGVLLYWITQNLFLLAQGQLLKVPSVRTLFGIPQMPFKTEAQKAEAREKAERQMKQAWSVVSGKGGAPAEAATTQAAVNPFAASAAAVPSAAESAAAAAALASTQGGGARTSTAAETFYSKPRGRAAKQTPRKR